MGQTMITEEEFSAYIGTQAYLFEQHCIARRYGAAKEILKLSLKMINVFYGDRTDENEQYRKMLIGRFPEHMRNLILYDSFK